MNKEYIKVMQNDFTVYSVNLTIEDLINNTLVEYYNPITNEGYQRQLNSSHYKKIARYLAEKDNPILPTSILTAVDPFQISENKNLLYIQDKLRVVDGQHRIEGIKYLKKENPKAFEKIKQYGFSALIMVIPKEKKVYEIESFININKTSKPVKTDLAIQLMEKIKENDILKLKEDISICMATKISKELNKNKESIWFNAIKLDDSNCKGKTISINAFHKSLIILIENYLKYTNICIENIDTYNNIAIKLSQFIEEGWKIIENKWPNCFNDINNYNIKKGIGVYPLNQLLGDLIGEYKSNSEDALKKFKNIINKSNVKENDWIIGGNFSAYNSKAGFRTIQDKILNK